MPNKSFLPSKDFVKKLAIIIVSVLLIVLLNIFIKNYKNKESSPKKAEVKTVTISELVTTDSDSDGIPDWEESLWGTDPHKLDTDGDGVTDTVYIEKRKAELNQNPINADGSTPENETTELSKEIFATIVSLKQSGNLNTESVGMLADSISSKVNDSKLIADNFQASDIKITNQTKLDYKKKLLAWQDKNSDKNIGSELVLLEKYLDEESIDSLQQITAIGQAYKDFANSLIKVDSISTASDTQLKLANSAYKISIACTNIGSMFENPLVGIVGVSQYKDNLDALEQNFIDLEAFIK